MEFMKEDGTCLWPLTSVQREIWFDQILHPDVPIYNIGGYVRIDGPADPAVFEKALDRVVSENDALRIILHEDDSVPSQEFRDDLRSDMSFRDFSGEKDPLRKAEEHMRTEFAKPFRLYEGPLFRFGLLRVSEDCHLWLQKYHHLITDGWGASLITRRTAEAYNAILAGKNGVGQSSYSYTDFIRDDESYLSSEKFSAHEKYWAEKYRDVPPPMIPRRYGHDEMRSGMSELWLGRDLYDRMTAFAKENGASVFHFILGAMYLYFLRTTDAEDFVIGLPVLNRSSKVFKKTVGLFVGVSPARFSFGTDITFAELIKRIGKVLRKDYRNQRFPVSEINRKAGLHREGRTQLFDLELSYEKHDYAADFGGSPAQAFPLLNGHSRSPLSVFVREFHEDQDVRTDFCYNLGCFTKEEAELLKARFAFLFEEALRHPEIPIRELEIMPDEERHRILTEWNDTKADYPKDRCIHHLFEEQAERTPDAVAVVFEDEQITYREMNTRANQLAHHLISLGVGPEVPVGICMERSSEMITGLLGILKAGGAYLPLDPAYPKERLVFMLEDSDAKILTTQKKLLSGLPECKAHIICTDSGRFQERHDNPVNCVRPGNPAYIIYTSGSTGRPKGVLISNASIARHCLNAAKYYELNTRDYVLCFSPLSFDASAEQIFSALSVGAASVIRGSDIWSSREFYDKTSRFGITVADIPPAYFQELLRGWKSRPEPFLNNQLRLIIVGGEAMPKEIPGLWQQMSSNRGRLVNAYGPTETTVTATAFEIISSEYGYSQNIPVGRPLAGRTVRILDRYGSSVPIGVPGELCISGPELARGYLGRPDLTAEKFGPDSFNHKPGSRVYKTGDIARYLPDGNIEFFTRMDHQIKIRGFRIEPGEIEAGLKRHSSVRDAAVIAVEKNEMDIDYEDDVESLILQISSLDRKLAEQLLSESERLTKERKIIKRNYPEFSVSFHIRDDFVNPPRKSQRNWILQRVLDEFSDDVRELDQISRRFVNGSERERMEKEWQTSQASYDDSQLIIQGQQVMQDWERPLMEAMADIITETHGHILEVGFGMGISATCIQERGVRSHTIIEYNRHYRK